MLNLNTKNYFKTILAYYFVSTHCLTKCIIFFNYLCVLFKHQFRSKLSSDTKYCPKVNFKTIKNVLDHENFSVYIIMYLLYLLIWPIRMIKSFKIWQTLDPRMRMLRSTIILQLFIGIRKEKILTIQIRFQNFGDEISRHRLDEF